MSLREGHAAACGEGDVVAIHAGNASSLRFLKLSTKRMNGLAEVKCWYRRCRPEPEGSEGIHAKKAIPKKVSLRVSLSRSAVIVPMLYPN